MNLGIICEFNPFHKGHKYLIDTVKGEGDAVICAMSGSFVQRGEPAVYDKFERTKAALNGGADLVIEIPSYLSTLSAQGFAMAGVRTLEATGICDALAFGAECGNVGQLEALAEEIKKRDGEIALEMKKGLTYAQARQNVIDSPLLKEPNNLLALEYLSCTKLKPIAVKRIGKGHDTDDETYSASRIRELLPQDKTASLKNCEAAVLYKLRNMSREELSRIEDVSEGLENRIAEAAKTAKSVEELYDLIKTKRYTHSRIRRIVLRAFLDINKSYPSEPVYLRILGFNEKGKELLSQMKSVAELPVITKYSQAKETGGEVLRLFEEESRITDLHALCFAPPKPCGFDKTAKIIVK